MHIAYSNLVRDNFQLFRKCSWSQNAIGTFQVSEIKERCMSKGFQPDQIEECIEEYEELNVWSVNQTKTKITFVD